MRLIDADALLSQYKGNILTAQIDYAQGARDVIDDIRNAPTVDAVTVVRCNDCDMFKIVEGCGGICNFFNRSVQVDDFCSFGAKMGEEK